MKLTKSKILEKKSDRIELLEAVKRMGFTKEKGFRILTQKEHKELVKGKKIVFSKQAIKDLKRMSKYRATDGSNKNGEE